MSRTLERGIRMLLIAAGLLCLREAPEARAASASLGLSVTGIKADTSAPVAVADLTAAVNPGLEGQLVLSWTSPDGNTPPIGQRVASYVVKMATFGVDSLAGDTTAWWNGAAFVPASAPVPQNPGSAEFLSLSGLEPGATLYFAIRSTDSANNLSPIDLKAATPGLQAKAWVPDLRPSSPTAVAAVAWRSSVTVSWTAVNASDLWYYLVHVDSTSPFDFADEYTISVASTATSLDHTGLAPGKTYSYYVTAVDKGAPTYAGQALESERSQTASAQPIKKARRLPMQTFGYQVEPSNDSVSLSWSPTVRFDDGVPFADPAAPEMEELWGYDVSRATSICPSTFTSIATLPPGTTSYTDLGTGGAAFYYKITSFNTLGPSTGTQLILTSLGEGNLSLEDCVKNIYITPAQIAALNKELNNLGGDIAIVARLRPEDTNEQIVQSAEFRAFLEGVQELKDFHFPTPVRITLGFLVAGGKPVPPTGFLGPRGYEPGAAPLDAQTLQNLGMYWDNGAEFKKMYGKVDPVDQSVTVETPNLGRYQIRTQQRTGGLVLDTSNLSSRVITPNGDGKNDVLIFTYDPGTGNAEVSGKIYDLSGAFVSDMRPGLVPNTLIWDGMMNGRAVTNGVYVYQIKGGGKTLNGTIVVAR